MSAALFIARASSKARCLQNPVGMLWQSGGRSRLAGTTNFSSSPDDSLPESLYITLEEYQQLLSDGVLRSLYPPPEPSGKLTMVDNRGGKLLEDIEVSDQLKKVEGAITDDQDNDLKLMNMNFEDLCDEDKILVFFKRIWMKWNEEMVEKRSGVGQDSIQVFEWYARHPDILFNLCRKKLMNMNFEDLCDEDKILVFFKRIWMKWNEEIEEKRSSVGQGSIQVFEWYARHPDMLFKLCRKKLLQDDYRQALISIIDCCMKQDFTSAIAYLHRADTDILAYMPYSDAVACSLGAVDRLVHLFFMQKTGLSKGTQLVK
ncbi:hypothetical protein RJ640_025366 [Escallonia rubra]|uniref:Uncharacterized protein n=1 Tax=Escallonia rubra TaxID=112253 RepID=A0AA88U7D4_9ASTE|nr:hypothetical protein RJ640_025366 [Escallonia rubra]